MNAYELHFTEYNGEQEYSYDYLLYANSYEAAENKAKDFVGRWYAAENRPDGDVEWTDYLTIEFFGGEIAIVITSICKTTLEKFTKVLVDRFTI